MAVSPTSLPFSEQIDFFRSKLNLPTASWMDIYTREHDYAFVVAGANRNALVQDFRQAVEKAIVDGTTLEDFRKDFDRIVTSHGWSYNGSRNWRSQVIYDTNLNSSYNAGRYAQQQAISEDRPYWRYIHSDAVVNPRIQHVLWNGMVLRSDDPFWGAHYPPNGWGCHCRVRSLGPRDLERLGKTGPDTAPPVQLISRTIGQNSPGGPRSVMVPEGIDPGFEYTPGLARLNSAVPLPRIDDELIPAAALGMPNRMAADPLPTPRPFPESRILPNNLTEEAYVERYLAEFGATLGQPAVFADVMGERLVVGKELFITRKTGLLKANKNGRGKWLLMLADTLQNPDEIWMRVEWLGALNKAVVRRRYIARYQVETEGVPALAVFEVGSDGWLGVTTFQPRDDDYLEALRQGVRIYQRSEEE